MSEWKCDLTGVMAKWPSRQENILKDFQPDSSFIQKNAMIPIMGPSGQGKSTLLYLMAALKWPSQGQITWTFPDNQTRSWNTKGPTPNDASWLRRERFGFAFQDNTLSAHLKVLENIAYPLVLKGENWCQARQKAEKQLAEVLLPDEKIEDFIKSFPTQLSGGQQQRVALAQALIHDPWVLFADEPTGQLDYGTRSQVMTVLKDWVKPDENKRRLIWVTHHHTDDLEIMGIDTLLFVNNGICKECNGSDLGEWIADTKRIYKRSKNHETLVKSRLA